MVFVESTRLPEHLRYDFLVAWKNCSKDASRGLPLGFSLISPFCTLINPHYVKKWHFFTIFSGCNKPCIKICLGRKSKKSSGSLLETPSKIAMITLVSVQGQSSKSLVLFSRNHSSWLALITWTKSQVPNESCCSWVFKHEWEPNLLLTSFIADII